MSSENLTENVKNDVSLDPYAYLDRDFTSEKFKIEIRGLPKYYGVGEFKRLLNDKLKLASNKIKVPFKRSAWAYVCFRNEEDRQNAIKALNKYNWKGKTLSAETAKAAPDPLVKKRKDNSGSVDDEGKRIKIDVETQQEQLKASTVPFWNVPYDEQLQKKQEEIKQILTRLGRDLGNQNVSLKGWLNEQKKKYDGLPCELWNIRSAKTIDGYRNKCEFSVGIDQSNNLPTVGFRVGSYATGSTGVASIQQLRHIPECMKKAVEIFEASFLRSNLSDLEVYDPELQTGHFKQLTMRCAANNQLMIVVGINPQQLTDTEVDKFKETLKEFFLNGPGQEAQVTSLYLQKVLKKQSNEDRNAPEHLLGETHIYETISGLKFRISPEAFFQINTEAAEILYNSAMELVAPMDESTVVDICCGTGTIGLCFAKKCKQVLGIEIVPEAVADAKTNAVDNAIGNTDFFAGKAEEILTSVLCRATCDDVIAVVDPPRAGLHQKAVVQLRKARKLRKLVYVSCNPQMALKNFVELGRPCSKTLHGDPLVPIRAVSVDLFPHTKHCELVIFFQRYNSEEIENKN